jgi:hypothetical protein
MPEPKTCTGSCHCGAVRFGATLDLSNVIECNCSHCERKGLLLAFTAPAQFTLRSGETDLTEYRFNKKVIQHLFCRHCGVEPFARGQMPDGTPMMAINVRCLEGLEIDSLKRKPFDGRSQ